MRESKEERESKGGVPPVNGRAKCGTGVAPAVTAVES